MNSDLFVAHVAMSLEMCFEIVFFFFKHWGEMDLLYIYSHVCKYIGEHFLQNNYQKAQDTDITEITLS